MSAMYANRNLSIKSNEVNSSIEKLSSGMRINRAGDDASGLAVSEKLRSQIRGLNQAERNIENGVSFIQTTEGYLQETQDILHRLRELSVNLQTVFTVMKTGCRSRLKSLSWLMKSTGLRVTRSSTA
jgi:flagellin